MLRAYYKSILGVCGDFGTESILHEAPYIDLDKHLKDTIEESQGHLLLVPPQDLDPSNLVIEPPVPPPPQLEFARDRKQNLFTHCIYVPGMKHNMDNLLKDILKNLRHWDEARRHLKSLERLLGDRDLRLRLRDHCFSDTEFYDMFRTFSATTIETRWDSVIEFIADVLFYEVPLQKHWDMNKFLRGNLESLGAATTRAIAKDFDDAVKSTFMWSYARMLNEGGEIVHYMSMWSEGCECHQEMWTQSSSYVTKRRTYAKVARHGDMCPFKGRRGPELACGYLSERIKEIEGCAEASVLKHMHGLAEVDVNKVSSDWHVVRNSLCSGLILKLSFWDTLPYKFSCRPCPVFFLIQGF